jgi:D-arabinose 1-dehydrogenase-like Zn-dependent alcohol dehydrogenase
VVISTGAAGGFLAIKLARALGARTMFIDSIANARELSVSARLSLGVADRVLSQWPNVAQSTGAEYRGAVI